MAPEYPLILEDCEYPNLTFSATLDTTANFYKTYLDSQSLDLMTL